MISSDLPFFMITGKVKLKTPVGCGLGRPRHSLELPPAPATSNRKCGIGFGVGDNVHRATRTAILMGCVCIGGCTLTPSRRPRRDAGLGPAKGLILPTIASRSGRLVDLRRTVRIMPVQSRDYQPPQPWQLETARLAFAHLVEGRIGQAAIAFSALEMVVSRLVDGERHYVVVQERAGTPLRGWGFFALADGSRRPYVIQAPHPRNDRHTVAQAFALMASLGARALIVSTAYRCAALEPSRCVGRTVACGGKRRRGRYRASDMAHTDNSLFQVAHEVLLRSDRNLIAVQLHGFDRRPGRPLHMIVSDGTRWPPARRSISNQLVRRLWRAGASRKDVVSCNSWDRRRPLCGTHNVQGRFANGSKDPCRLKPTRARNRFLHVEQSLDARRAGGWFDPGILERALAALRPARR